MFLTTHAVAGIVIGQKVGSPLLGFFLGIISHFILDCIPHGDNILFEKYEANNKDKFVLTYILGDILMFFVFLAFFYYHGTLQNTVVLFSLLGSILPDVFSSIHYKTEKFFETLLEKQKLTAREWLLKHSHIHSFLKRHVSLHEFVHYVLQRKNPISLRFGLLIQLIFIASIFYLAL